MDIGGAVGDGLGEDLGDEGADGAFAGGGGRRGGAFAGGGGAPREAVGAEAVDGAQAAFELGGAREGAAEGAAEEQLELAGDGGVGEMGECEGEGAVVVEDGEALELEGNERWLMCSRTVRTPDGWNDVSRGEW